MSSLLVQPDKFFGRAAILLPEYPIKITEVVDAAFLADFNDLQAGFQKQPRRIIHPFYVDEFSGRHVQDLRKDRFRYSWERLARDSRRGRPSIKFSGFSISRMRAESQPAEGWPPAGKGRDRTGTEKGQYG